MWNRWGIPDLAVASGRTVFTCWANQAGAILMLYGVIATFQSFPSFGRVYAAYGGVFIIMSLIFAMVVDKQMPDKYDVIGAIICIVGVLVMLLPSRA